jgi:hypothetical protein
MPKKNTENAATTRRSRQEQLDIAAAADAREGIRQGLEDSRKGRGQPAREFFKEFETKYRPLR